MTSDEFEAQYAREAQSTVENLRGSGRIVLPCDCGEDRCEGWQSTTLERANEDQRYLKQPLWTPERIRAAVAEADARDFLRRNSLPSPAAHSATTR
jgi:hypothetical protein